MATGTEAARGLSDTGLLLPGALAPAEGLARQVHRPALSPGRPVPGQSSHLPGPLLSGRGTGSPSGRDTFWNGLGFLASSCAVGPALHGLAGGLRHHHGSAQPCFGQGVGSPRRTVRQGGLRCGLVAMDFTGAPQPPSPRGERKERKAGAKGRATPRRVSYGPAGRPQGSDGLCVTGLPLGCSCY